MFANNPIKWTVGIFFFVFLFTQHGVAQQLQLPRISPAMKVVGTIGFSTVTIDYSSPAIKGREVWGKLVPYGLIQSQFGNGNPMPWRAGANENTVITFSDDVKVEGHVLPAGSYGVHMIPSESEWTIIFSKNYWSWGSFFYEEKEDALRFQVKPQEAPFTEWLTYGLTNFTSNSAEVVLQWEKLAVKFKVECDTATLILKNIKNQLCGQLGFSWQGWNQAAFYCMQTNSNFEQGRQWLEQSFKLNENSTNRNTLGYLLDAAGKTAEAEKVFRENVLKFPGDWNVLDSLGEFCGKYGNKKDAIKYYTLALKKAPQGQKNRIENTLKTLQGK